MISYTVVNGVAEVFFETDQHNALTLDQLKEVAALINKSSLAPDVKIVVLKSGGEKTFCAGANFNQLIQIDNFEDGKAFFMGFGNLILAIRNCQKIIVGRIQGRAIGGGVGLAAACDFTIATQYASARLSELNIGLGPLVIGPMVARKMGLANLGSMALNPTEWVTAKEAKTKGLYNEVFDTQVQADEYLVHFIEGLRKTSDVARAMIKKMLWEGTEDWDMLLMQRAEQSANLLMTQECKDQISQFLNKNKQA